MRSSIQKRTAAEIKLEYMKESSPWLLAYSGGKDSSAVLNLLMLAMANSADLLRKVYVVFCDTGVENPLVTEFARFAFRQINAFAKRNALPISTYILRPKKKDGYWVKVVGRGCPPPTNRFRWCTDKLRVNPVRDFCIKNELTNVTTILGVRKGESNQRDRTIKKYVKSSNYLRYYDSNNRLYYLSVSPKTGQ